MEGRSGACGGRNRASKAASSIGSPSKMSLGLGCRRADAATSGSSGARRTHIGGVKPSGSSGDGSTRVWSHSRLSFVFVVPLLLVPSFAAVSIGVLDFLDALWARSCTKFCNMDIREEEQTFLWVRKTSGGSSSVPGGANGSRGL